MLWRAQLRFLARHPWQLGLALSAVAVGVAVIAAVDLAVDSSRRAFMLSFEAVTGTATHQIVGGARGIDERLYVRMRTELGLQDAAPIVEGRVQIGDRNLHLLGIDPFAERNLRELPLADPGSADAGAFRPLLLGPALWLSASTAAELGLAAQDPVELQIAGRRAHGTLIGTLDDRRMPGLRDVVVVDIATAQDWLGLAGSLSRVDLRADPAELARLAAWLPAGARLLEAEARNRRTLAMSNAFAANLTAMSLLAMLVGGLLVFNSTSFMVLQRRELFANLRALGATRRELLWRIAAEGLLIGLLGSGLGLAIGLGLGEALLGLVVRSINDLYFAVEVRSVRVAPLALIRAFSIGVLASLVAVLPPAFEAARAVPRLTRLRSALEMQVRRRSPRLALAGAAMIGAAALLFVSSRALIAGFAGLFLAVIGAALTLPLLLLIASRAASALARPCGPLARLCLAEVGANLSRTGIAVAALAVALSASIGVSVMVDSFRESLRGWLAATLQADVYLSAPGPAQQARRLEPALVDAVLALPGMTGHSTSRRTVLEAHGERLALQAISPGPAGLEGFDVIRGGDASLAQRFAAGGLLISESLAYRRGLDVGGQLQLPTDEGPVTFAIAAVYRDYGSDQGNIVLHRESYLRYWHDPLITGLGLHLRAGGDPGAFVERLRATAAPLQSVSIYSNAEVRELSLDVFERTFVITDVLYWLAIGVAFAGVLSALLAMQLEREALHALLRALGATPAEITGLVLAQTGFLGLVAGLAAIPLGVGMGWLLLEVINQRAFGWTISLRVAPADLLAAVALAAAAALTAGLYPARRSARVSAAIAMREE